MLRAMIDRLDEVHSFFENQWIKILELFGHNEKAIFVIGSSLILLFSFCGINSLFTYLDLTGTPKFFLRYKIQKDKNVPVSFHRYMDCLKVSARNELMTCGLVFLLYPLMRDWMSCERHLPTFWKVVVDFYIFLVVAEFVFYYSHRCFHLPLLYKRVHKKHHEWIAPISLAASYAHPVEHLISNALPLLLGPILCGAHVSEAWVWFMMSQVSTCLHHSDYHLPFLSSPQFHDFHHVKFTENFGITGWLDTLHGTNSNYKKSIQCKRHVTFYNLEPISKKFPSKNNKEN